MTFDGRRNTPIATDVVSADFAAGLEVDFRRIVFARLGVDQFQEFRPLGEAEGTLTPRPAIGLGVRVKRFALDYAYSNPGSDADLFAHVVSVNFGLSKGTAPARRR